MQTAKVIELVRNQTKKYSMSEEKVYETLKMYLFYGINTKDKVWTTEQCDFYFFLCIYLFIYFLFQIFVCTSIK